MGVTGLVVCLCAALLACGCGNALEPPADLGTAAGNDLAEAGDDLAPGDDLAGVVSAAHSAVTVSPASVTANGSATTTITVTVADDSGVAVPGETVALAVSGSANTLSAAGGATDAGGVFTATLASTKAEAKTVTATIGALTKQAVVTFTAGAPARSTSRVVATAGAVAANGTAASTLTVEVRDAEGNAVTGQTVAIAVSGSANTLSAASGMTDANGRFTATLASTQAEIKRVTVTVGAVTLRTVVGFTAAGACAGTPLFPGVPAPFLGGPPSVPTFVALYDFNKDGKLDILGGQGVRLGNGDGTFQSTLTGAVTDLTMVLAELNGNANIDLVWGSPTGGLEVQLGAGDGTFAAAAGVTTPYAVANGQIAVGDFNGDTIADIALSSSSPSAVTILLGNGNGTFQTGVSHAVPRGGAGWLTTGDFNGDTKRDVAVTSNNATVSVLLGNGDGTLQNPTLVSFPENAASPGANAIVARDLDADGAVDLVVLASNTLVDVLRGNGNGTFKPPASYPTAGAVQVAIGDVDGDGALDLATAQGDGTFNYHVSFLFGVGDGTFRPYVKLAVGNGPQAVALGDLDGDGLVDIATGNYQGHDASILLGIGDGTFRVGDAHAVSQVGRMRVGDFDGDGKTDIASVTAAALSVLRSNGDGTFKAEVVTNTGVTWGGTAVATGDFNGDNHLDLVSVSYDSMSHIGVFLGDGAGGFAPPVDYGADTDEANSVAVDDVNNDDKLDLVVGHRQNGYVSLLLGNGDGTFQPASVIAIAGSQWVGLGDFSEDGNVDLLTAGNLALGNGDGTFGIATAVASTPGLIADIDQDTHLDILGSAILLGNGNGTFGSPLAGGLPPGGVTAIDLDGDGLLDLVWDPGGNELTVLRGNGDGTFRTPLHYVGGSANVGVLAFDVEGDGHPDLVTADSLDGNFVTVLPYMGCLP